MDAPKPDELPGDGHDRISASELRANLASVLSRVGYENERVIVTRNGSEAVALLPLHTYRRFLEWERRGEPRS